MFDFTPAKEISATGHAGTYRRALPVALERLYENALDWEHLPWVHPESFSAISCLDLTADRWCARTQSPRGDESVIELALDRASRRWVTRVLSGSGAGNEIWTHAFPVAGRQQVDIVVDFFLPQVAASDRASVGAAYGRLYQRLYDEDVAMMVERSRQLERRSGIAPGAARSVCLGPLDGISLPLEFTLGGRSFILVETLGHLRAFPAQCPHMLGPLSATGVAEGTVTCPWHGYQFDLATGQNLSGHTCRLHPILEIRVEASGDVLVEMTDSR
ncbi:MAG: Rieske 2Fe-2S domain-containing protein [Pseudomonadales bacterium]